MSESIVPFILHPPRTRINNKEAVYFTSIIFLSELITGKLLSYFLPFLLIFLLLSHLYIYIQIIPIKIIYNFDLSP